MGKEPVPASKWTDLSRAEHAANVGKALLKGIPYIGATIEQFVFGPLVELRMKRIEATLAEFAEAVQRGGSERHVATEQFANLLEEVLPQLGRTTNDDKRTCFRDLLTNATSLDAGDAEWEQADLAKKLLTELEGPALATLAALAKLKDPEAVALVSRPLPQLVTESEFDWDNPIKGDFVIGYDWPVVEEWWWRMNEMRLVTHKTGDGRGGFGGIGLTRLGRLLVRWAVGDQGLGAQAKGSKSEI